MGQNGTNGVPTLTERQLNALPYLVGEQTVTEGARLAEIGRTTFYRWMEDDDFRREFERLRNAACELAYSELKGLMLKSVLVLGELLEDPNPLVRIRAAQIALSTHLKANELKRIEERLDLMEDALPLWSKRNMRW